MISSVDDTSSSSFCSSHTAKHCCCQKHGQQSLTTNNHRLSTSNKSFLLLFLCCGCSLAFNLYYYTQQNDNLMYGANNQILSTAPIGKRGVSSDSNIAANLTFFDTEKEGTNCSISASSISRMKYLGSGYSGQVFEVDMDCYDNEAQKEPISQTNRQKRTKMAVKMLTFPADKNDTKKIKSGRIGIYQSEEEKTQEKLKRLYERLTSMTTMMMTINGTLITKNTSSTSSRDARNEKNKILKYFSLRLGTVNLPRPMVEHAIVVANRALKPNSPYRKMILDKDNNNYNNVDSRGSVDGQLYVAIPDGKSLSFLLNPSRNKQQPLHHDQRLQMVRDVVYMYRHMYQRRVLHCDMKLEHLLYSTSTNTTTIIDLDSYRIFPSSLLLSPQQQQQQQQQQPSQGQPPKKQRHDLEWQQWQLFSVIAHICDFETQQRQALKDSRLSASLMPCVNSRSLDKLDPRRIYSSIFEKCDFGDSSGNNPKSMVWKDDMLNRTEETYQALADWCGLE